MPEHIYFRNKEWCDMSVDEEDDDTNLNLFRDCLFSTILEKSNPRQQKQKKTRVRTSAGSNSSIESSKDVTTTTDPAQLVDFSDYLASEIFPSLPRDLQRISHRALQENAALSEKWSLPLSLSTYEEIIELVPPSVNDSLEAYELVKPPQTDLQSFLSPAIVAYLTAAAAAPPKWAETKVTACEICDRDWVPMTYHHLIPKAVHAKVQKRGWHEESQLNSVAWLCRACHTFVHRMASNEELAKEWFTVERICERDDVQKWANWVRKVRWKKN
ncbi:hypothetical protein LTR05_008113 [Lithohypha guttulata]|uniref:Uncharacterized protein n=1 Tax=Lithohypha guttulata TaxID=1690604 RepID=A0AAN7YD75_9EURO|nr:hypothetical protein LTR05_008113 [Lithohypha guttulata]